MVLTRDYKESIRERAERDPDFATALIQEVLTAILEGDPEIARIILRELVHSTIGFEALAKELNKSSKSIHRMLSPQGNPTMDNLTNILVALQKDMDTNFKVILSSHKKVPKRRVNHRMA